VVARFVLPYSFDLVLHAERRDPTHLETSLTGALEGVARWYLTDLGSGTGWTSSGTCSSPAGS
jgi:hypothetical protein